MICTTEDNYVLEYRETMPSWIVWLNSGLAVFQDDGKPGVEEYSAWIRLRNYCQETGDYIVGMMIRFRSNTHSLPENADGYYFGKGARGSFELPKTHQLFYVGTLQNDVLNVECWKVPEMLYEYTEQRPIDEDNPCLIKRNTSQSLELKG